MSRIQKWFGLISPEDMMRQQLREAEIELLETEYIAEYYESKLLCLEHRIERLQLALGDVTDSPIPLG
ncbi:MAG: hypothetical protein E6Q97_17835 [Desulfurellales bacterium]|nr:MAG: hypothetical protein E6Q97_17835 [Desulfurellales bacterium]